MENESAMSVTVTYDKQELNSYIQLIHSYTYINHTVMITSQERFITSYT